MSLSYELGKRIKSLRKKAGLTQEELANAINISPHFLSRIENGKEKPSLDTIEKIAETLDVSVYDLFKFDTQSKTYKENYDKKISVFLKSLSKKEKLFLMEEIKSLVKNIKRLK